MNHYKPATDGLRAIAVILVFVFHANSEWMPGGFVGVDVFFVISGFLISRLIMHQTQNKTFEAKVFFKRRIFRILPALLGMFFVVLAAACFVLGPSELETHAKETIAGMLSLYNVYEHVQDNDYFDAAASGRVLAHVWSLSLEEQYYLVWPFVLLLILKFKQPWVQFVSILGLAVLGLCVSQWGATHERSLAYGQLPFRAYEFLVGTLGVYLAAHTNRLPHLVGEVLTLLGYALILASALMLDPQVHTFPGIHALAPCVGALMVILFADQTKTGSIIRLKPVVWLGLLSYSLYLYHYPVIKLSELILSGDATPARAGVLFLLSLAFAWLSWIFVEQTFRKPRGKIAQKHRGLALIVLGVLLLTWCASLIHSQGWPSRFPSFFSMTQTEILAERERYWEGFGKNKESQLTVNEGMEQVVVMGNSHAQDLIYSLRMNGFDQNITYLDVFHACYNYGAGFYPQDRRVCEQTFARNMASPKLKTAQAIFLHEDMKVFDPSGLEHVVSGLRALNQEAPIIIFGGRLILDEPLPSLAKKHAKLTGLNRKAVEHSNFKKRLFLNKSLQDLVLRLNQAVGNLHYVDMLALQCGQKHDDCMMTGADGELMYFDRSHMTLSGGKVVGHRLMQKHGSLIARQKGD